MHFESGKFFQDKRKWLNLCKIEVSKFYLDKNF